MRVVVAPDKFKGSLTAAEVAAALARGVRAVRPAAEVVELPVADGGDGTVAAAVAAGWQAVEVDAVGPTGEPVRAAYAVLGDRAVVELAGVVGLQRLPGGRLDPLGASTHGLGLVLRAAADAGATEIVLGLGGAAATDGGAGMIEALSPRGLAGVRVVVATDVDSPLLGPSGAAAVFGPQKGATPEQVEVLERRLADWARRVGAQVGRNWSATPGAGAAGGTGFAALALLGATVRPGIELVLELVGFAGHAAGADLVVTGEGSLDSQSLAGKAPVGVARAAAAYGVPVVAVAGRNLLGPAEVERAGLAAAYALSDLEPDPARSIAHAADLLEATGRRIAADRLGPTAANGPDPAESGA